MILIWPSSNVKEHFPRGNATRRLATREGGGGWGGRQCQLSLSLQTATSGEAIRPSLRTLSRLSKTVTVRHVTRDRKLPQTVNELSRPVTAEHTGGWPHCVRIPSCHAAMPTTIIFLQSRLVGFLSAWIRAMASDPPFSPVAQPYYFVLFLPSRSPPTLRYGVPSSSSLLRRSCDRSGVGAGHSGSRACCWD